MEMENSDEVQKGNRGDRGDDPVPSQANVEEPDGPILTEEMEKTIAETALIDMVEEDLDEAVRNLANLASSTFDEFEEDSMDSNINTGLGAVSQSAEIEKAPSPKTSNVAPDQIENKPEEEIVMLGSSSEVVAPYVIKSEPIDEEVTMDMDPIDSITGDTQSSDAAVHQESLMPNLPADFSLKSFDWEENTNAAESASETPAPVSFGIKIRSDLRLADSPVLKNEPISPDSKVPLGMMPSTVSKDPTPSEEQSMEKVQMKEEPNDQASSVCTESTEDLTSVAANDHSEASDVSEQSSVQEAKKKRGRKKKADKIRELAEAAAREGKSSKNVISFAKPKSVRAGVRLMENDTPVQWLVDMVRTTLRRRHLYSAHDMDTCLDQLTILPCYVKIERLRESEIIAACKRKKKHLEGEPPQNYTSPKVKVNRNEVLDIELARKEFAKSEEKSKKMAENEAYKEQSKKRKLLEKEKDKERQKKMRLISSDEDSDVDVKPTKVEVEKEKKKVASNLDSSADEPPSEGERSRESSISRPEEKSKEQPRSRDKSEERKKEDLRLEEKIKRKEEYRKEQKEKERREKSKKHIKPDKERSEKKLVEVPKPLQTPSFKIPKKADNSKPTKDVREFAILPDPATDQRKQEKKVIVQKVTRIEKRNYTVERGAQTDPLSCLKNNPGVSLEDLMLLFRQQVSEAPIVLARWSRHPPVAAELLVRHQRDMQKMEEEKLARHNYEKRKEAEKLKNKISVHDYMNKKYTPKPLSKMPHSERRHHEAHRREHKSSVDPATTNGKPVSSREVVKPKPIDAEPERLASIPSNTPTEDHSCAMENEPLSYTPPGNSPDSPEHVERNDTSFNLASLVKTGSSFMPHANSSQNIPMELDQARFSGPSMMSVDERLRQQHQGISNHQSRRHINSPAPQPVPAPMLPAMAQNSPQAAFPPAMHPMHMRTPPQLGSEASRSPAVNGPGFPYNSPNAFMMPQPVPPPQQQQQAPVPVPAPVPVASPWNVSSKLHVQNFERQPSGGQLPTLYRDTSEEVSFWKIIREEYSIPDILLNKCIKEMMGPPGCKLPRCPSIHEFVSISSTMQQVPPLKSLENFLSIRQKKFIVYYQTGFEELVKKLVRSRQPRLLLCLCYEVMFRDDEIGPYWWNKLVEAMLQLANDINDDNGFEVKRILVYVMNHGSNTPMLRNEIARLSIRSFQHLPDVLNELFRDRDYVAHKSIVELLVEHLLLNKEQRWVKLAVEILIANVSENVWRCFKQGVIHNLASMCGEVERNSLYVKSGRMPPSSAPSKITSLGQPIPTVVTAAPPLPRVPPPAKPMPPPIRPPVTSVPPPVIKPPLPPTPPPPVVNPPLPSTMAPTQPPPPPPPESLLPPPLPPTALFSTADLNRPYSPSEKADDELDDPADLDYNAELINKLCSCHEKPELIKDLYTRMHRAINSNDFARVASIVLRHPGDKLPRGRILYGVLKERMQRPSQGFLQIASAATVQANAQPVLMQKFHILLGTVGVNILLDLVDQEQMTDALSIYITTKSMRKLGWENVTSYRDSPISLEQILLKSCKMCFRMGQTQEAFDLLKRFNQTSGIDGTKDLLDVLELLIQNFVKEHRYKESFLLWTQARETKFKVCAAHNLPRELPKNTNTLMVRLLNSNDTEMVLQLWKEIREYPMSLDKKTTRALVVQISKINMDFALDVFNAGRLNLAYPLLMPNHRLLKVYSYWLLEEIMTVLEDVLRRLASNLKGTDLSDFSLTIVLEELPDPHVSTDTIEDVVIPYVDNSLRSLQSRVDEALSSMNPPVVLNPVADPKTLRANPVSLRCHLVQRMIRGQRLRQQLQQQQQQQQPQTQQ